VPPAITHCRNLLELPRHWQEREKSIIGDVLPRQRRTHLYLASACQAASGCGLYPGQSGTWQARLALGERRVSAVKSALDYNLAAPCEIAEQPSPGNMFPDAFDHWNFCS